MSVHLVELEFTAWKEVDSIVFEMNDQVVRWSTLTVDEGARFRVKKRAAELELCLVETVIVSIQWIVCRKVKPCVLMPPAEISWKCMARVPDTANHLPHDWLDFLVLI